MRNSFGQRWLVRQDFGNGEVYSYSYTSSSGPYADPAIVTLLDVTTLTVEVADSQFAFNSQQR